MTLAQPIAGTRDVLAPDPVDAAAGEKAAAFLALLAKWNRVYNLTAITDTAQMLTHHLRDSLAILPALDRVLAERPAPRLLDVGSGGGLPGIPLALARPHWKLTLLDANGKKVTFIRQAIAELGISNASAIHARVEDHRDQPFDVIVSRAFASLREFVDCTRHLLAPGGCWAAMKGAVPESELRELPPDIACTEIVRLEVEGLDALRHLLLLKVKTE